TGVPYERVVGLGITVTGLVDPERGVEYRVSYDGRRQSTTEVPIKERLTSKINLPVNIETNAWAMALADRWHGNRETNFIFLYCARGIGAAVVTGGRLHRGRGTAGEIGHVQVPQASGLICNCGGRGCLEAKVSVTNIMRRLRSHGPLYEIE